MNTLRSLYLEILYLLGFISGTCFLLQSVFLLSSFDGRVSTQTVSSLVWTGRSVGQLGGARSGQRRFNLGGSRVQSKRVHDVAHLLLRQFPVFLPAVGANQGTHIYSQM